MLWICCVLVAWWYRPKEKRVNIYITPEPFWHDGMTPAEFDIYLAEKQAKEAREVWFVLYPELRYEILRQQYECGDMDKVTYETALDNLINDIEI